MGKKIKDKEEFDKRLNSFLEVLDNFYFAYSSLDALLEDHCDFDGYIKTLKELRKRFPNEDLESIESLFRDATDPDCYCPK